MVIGSVLENSIYPAQNSVYSSTPGLGNNQEKNTGMYDIYIEY